MGWEEGGQGREMIRRKALFPNPLQKPVKSAGGFPRRCEPLDNQTRNELYTTNNEPVDALNTFPTCMGSWRTDSGYNKSKTAM